MKPKISILMAVFNCAATLKESIDSILFQTFKDFEFIIINDGSTDDTHRIIEGYQDRRIRLINNKKNLGLIKSLNIGLQEAKGEYIARMDGDDISLPERLSIQFNYLEKNKNVFLVGSSALIIDENGRAIKKAKIVTGRDLSTILPKGNSLIHPSIMFRNIPNLFYREKMLHCEDYDFYLRLITEGRTLKNLNDPLIKYRISPNSISRTKALLQRHQAEKAREFFFQRQKNGFDQYEEFNLEAFKMELQKLPLESFIWPEITSCLSAGKTKEVRMLCIEYLKFSFSIKVIICYLFSFLGARVIRILFN
jgi:glycosyltransferase involved in cell wall biosynthesis